ncbi:MAG: peptidoglycan DD-metalloendopeptidase family protein [Nitriliruptoraceae bacterium]
MAVVAMAVLTLVPTSAQAQDMDDLQAQLREAQEERERAQEALAETRAAEGDARDRLSAVERELAQQETVLAALERELALARESLAAAQERLAVAREELVEVNADLVEAEAVLDETRSRLELRIRAAFKYGPISFAEAFAGVRDVADFVNSTQYVSHVVTNDRQLVGDFETQLAAVELQRERARVLRERAAAEEADAAVAAEQIEYAATEQSRVAASIRERRRERAAALEELRTDRAALEGHLKGLEAESARIQAQLAELARRQASGANPGGWVRPVSGSISSPFGPRWGRMHYGVDLATSMGSGIGAAQSGTIVWRVTGCNPTSSWGCGGGFGNYVVVDHGGGFATVYAHMEQVNVSTNQEVSAGQSLGTVGNSGNSYGPHLHFELYDGGQRKNPCNYISC